MAEEIQGKRIAFLTANEGVEQVEHTRPWDAVREAWAEPELVLPGGVANPDQLRGPASGPTSATRAARGSTRRSASTRGS